MTSSIYVESSHWKNPMANRDPTAEIFAQAELDNLRRQIRLGGAEKIGFFEEMIDLAYESGALRPERLALRDSTGNS